MARKTIGWPVIALGVAAGAGAVMWCLRERFGPQYRHVATRDPTTNLPSANILSFRGTLQAGLSPRGGMAIPPPGKPWKPGTTTNGGSGG